MWHLIYHKHDHDVLRYHWLHLRNIITGVRVGFFPRKTCYPFWWNTKRSYDWSFISRNMRLMGDVCSKVRFKKQICFFVHVSESTVLTGLHLSRISNPHITVKWTLVRWYIFVQDPATYIWIYIDDTGQSGVVCKGTCLYLEYHYQDLSAFIIHIIYLYLSNTDHNFYWTINRQWTTKYLLVVSTYVPWQWMGLLV